MTGPDDDPRCRMLVEIRPGSDETYQCTTPRLDGCDMCEAHLAAAVIDYYIAEMHGKIPEPQRPRDQETEG